MQKLKFIISGGGTGGHIYPAIAIADELKVQFPDCEILFVGAKDKMEMKKVPQAGYQIKVLWISGLQRKLTLSNLLFPVKLIFSMVKSYFILKSFKPNVVIGTGGFASGAVVKTASWIGLPTLIQEQNSYPGITNKWLSKTVDTICVAYENLNSFFPENKIKFTGNPVRQDLLSLTDKKIDALAYFALDATQKTLLVLGGSLGSKKINELIAEKIDLFIQQRYQIIWQTGSLYFEQYSHFNQKGNVKVVSFIDRMDYVYAAADVIISRSGASSVSELCIVGKPVIFIPSPNVAEDHQTQNAKAIANKNGAILIKESELENRFDSVFLDLIANPKEQIRLGTNIHEMARPEATKDIVKEIVQLISKK